MNKLWKFEIEEILYKYCKKNQYLEDEEFWKIYAQKDWKWILKTKFVNNNYILIFTFIFYYRNYFKIIQEKI